MKPKLTLHPSFIFVLLLISTNAPTYLCEEDARYTNCRNAFTCGDTKLDLRYPFSGENRDSYCGEEKLTCEKQVPMITINDAKYRILDWRNTTQTITVARDDYWDGICVSEYKNSTFGNAHFQYDQQYNDLGNVTLFYCPSDSAPSILTEFYQESCGAGKFVFYTPLPVPPYSGNCAVVAIPIFETNASLVRENKITEALRNGFELNWEGDNGECEKCSDSGGECGVDEGDGGFQCFCVDGPHSATCKGKRNNVGVAIGATVGGVAALVVILGCVYFMIQRRRKIYQKSRSMELFIAPTSSGDTFASTTITSQSLSSYQSSNPVTRSYYFGVQVFTYEELEEATKNFDASRELGEGGFGTVYKGELKDGRTVAVKRHYESNSRRIVQFMNEVQILARLRHKNLVTLFGCTSKHSRELLLVYEFIPNGTVAYHLQGRGSKSTLLPWPIRLNIAVETAEALAYLHANDVIHRDVKTNNILLDDQFCVKVADFGLSRDFPTDVTHVSTAPQGTPGYVDPEYYQCYQLTDKSDVYSFGVVLVELISSLQAVDINRNRSDVNLSNMAIKKIQNQELHELVDPYLGFEKDPAMRRMTTAVAELAFRCLQQERDLRPCMDEVVEILRGIKSDGLGGREETEILDIRTDEAILLKKAHSPVSPNSVVDNWVSGSSVSNSS
ncbi:LEAF RUST 10 DISEASE-RESISTANCE LOCUS RECEPTOR-LIKE PROTEIN KINASE-like 1.4 isoform X3 [Vigna radiata var. radiata]|uniref:non-specific serine/threonine protein kinase n=1 Tax=Vigna radiata var. radiata TaxID=3916 RepID=A0A3Q0EXE9_VIGRR|nr:LEAF RUST 10 DISEASE-RESISTANCE LOCUS RECEPTOR-LIKE PROTEIN KINASE-like 1.4 isoform X3 [Vigna radiata var. radiata]